VNNFRIRACLTGKESLTMDRDGFFAPDYTTTRRRFIAAAEAVGAQHHSLTLPQQAPDGQSLSIDIAWLGASEPRRVLLHSSGLHGVEGFAGSAIQSNVLADPPRIGKDGALIFVHALNPYGMAWLRRVNENNVDLNRNFLNPHESRCGASTGYTLLYPLLNPQAPPSFDFFSLRAVFAILRFGYGRLKQAIAEGQYDYPNGLFYGGQALQTGPQLYRSWLDTRLNGVDYLFAIDVHTGLGPYAKESVFAELKVLATPLSALSTALDRPVMVADTSSLGYAIRGGLACMLADAFAGSRLDFLIEEFGTHAPLKILHVLREENRWHHYGDGGLSHRTKQAIVAAFYPASRAWRSTVLERGVTLVQRAAAFVFA
jgi:hypothetical protein